MSTSIGEQAENYAEVITGQIVANFDELATAIVECKELEEAKETYEKTSPLDNTLATINTLQERVQIIQDNLGDIVCDEYNSIEPLAVGLFGEWGSGKTHQLKLIKKHLLAQTREDNATTIIPVFFNAWRFEKEEHIILPLFQTLLDAVENHERTLKGKAKRGFKSTAYHLKNVLLSLHHGMSWSSAYKTVRGVVTNNLEDMREIANVVDVKAVQDKGQEKTKKEQVGEQSLTQLLQPDQLQSIYLNIPQWIEKITLFEKVNFVFLIDDLDRCLPENTLKMLESIKLFLDVPSCAFVLAVDDDVVERGVVHHYRDYLSIYHNKDTESAQGVLQHELPITGHEYLEKMIQLPIRLPVIDTVNVREFLEECSQGWIAVVDKDYWERIDGLKELGDKRREQVHYEMKPKQLSLGLLDFFKDRIPPKPRKIKRTAKLFESKIKLLHRMGLVDKCSYELLVKMTLLELFAPKILRFLQNNDYAETYRALYDFHYVKDKGNTEEKLQNTLYDTTEIKEYIESNKNYTQEKKDRYEKLITMISEHHSSRMVFDLSTVFNQREEYEALKVAIEYRESRKLEIKEQNSSKVTLLSEEMIEQLFIEDNPETWGATLRVYNEILNPKQLEELIEKAKEKKDKTFNNLPFISNPEWVGQIANFVDDESYITLLKASHDARFKSFDSKNKKKQIDMFQMTFAEYDKYCEITEIDKPKDEGWGRGRRPVINVNWDDAKNYIAWLNTKVISRYNLPTKEEWEIACDIEQGDKWHFGNDDFQLKEYAWYIENSEKKIHSVGELKSNHLDIFDMHGNIWEWCENGDSSKKRLCGGSWSSETRFLQINYKYLRSISVCNYYIGFRLLRTLP